MKFATVRDLKNRTSEMLRLVANGKDVLVTLHGRPVAVLHGINEDDLEDYILSHHPALRASIEQSERDYRRRGGLRLEDVIGRLEVRARRGRRRGRPRR